MIKKSLSTYRTAGQLIFFVLLQGEAIRLALFRALEHIVHRVHIGLVILFHVHAGNHVHQGIDVPILGRRFKNDIGNQRTIKECFCLCPERIALLALAFGVRYEGIDKL